MILHIVGIKESHLLLNGAEDTGIARVQAYNEVAQVVVLLHQGALLFKVHIGRAFYHGARLVAVGQFLGHQRTGIEYQVGLLQHLTSTHAD